MVLNDADAHDGPSWIRIQDAIDLIAPPGREVVRENIRAAELIYASKIPPEAVSGEGFIAWSGADPCGATTTLVVEGKSGENRTLAVCVFPVGARLDFNRRVKKILSSKSVRMADRVVVQTSSGMEFGSIGPVGIPSDWKLLVDDSLMGREDIYAGSGLVMSKLKFPPEVLEMIRPDVIIEPICASA